MDGKNFICEVPPIIPDSFEALAAAIYFDSSMNLNVVANVRLFDPNFRSKADILYNFCI